MLPTDRISYSAITERPQLLLPDGARMAVWVIVNVEEWDPREAMPRTVLTPPAGGSPMPDIPNWAWHEYGNRVGFWRFVDVFDALSIPAVLAINGSALAAYPAIVRAALEREWEFIGHGFTQRNMQKVENERADIRRDARGHRQRYRQAAARLAGQPWRLQTCTGEAGGGLVAKIVCVFLGSENIGQSIEWINVEFSRFSECPLIIVGNNWILIPPSPGSVIRAAPSDTRRLSVRSRSSRPSTAYC